MNPMAFMGLALWFVVLIIGALGVLAAVVACLLRKWKFALWTLGGTFAAAVLVGALGCLAIAYIWRPYDPTSETELKEAYQADFETLPPPGITVLKARQVIVGDAGGQWLLLKATPEEIEHHITKGFTLVKDIPQGFREAGGNAPSWWKPPLARLRFYENRDWTKSGGWSTSRAEIGVDADSGLIWFSAVKFN